MSNDKGLYNKVCASPECDNVGAIWKHQNNSFYCHKCAMKINTQKVDGEYPCVMRTGTIFVDSYDHTGARRSYGSRTSCDPAGDLHIMEAAIEFHYAAKRGVKFAVNLGELIILNANREHVGIKVGQVYEHHGGDKYRVIGFANLTSTKPDFVPSVLYASLKNGDPEIWSRPVDEFLEKFKT